MDAYIESLRNKAASGSLFSMKRAPHIAVMLAVVYILLSFNAYACLVPLYGGIQVTKGSDCTMPQEQPANQQCEAFKTLTVQTAPSALQAVDASAHAVVSLELDTLQTFISPLQLSARPCNAPPPTGDILGLTSVLRL